MAGIIYGYARCSTYEQLLSLEQQRIMIRSCAQEPTAAVYSDCGSSMDKNTNLRKLLDKITHGDEIYLTSVSRLTRSTKIAENVFDILEKKGVELYIIDQPLFNDLTDKCSKKELLLSLVLKEEAQFLTRGY